MGGTEILRAVKTLIHEVATPEIGSTQVIIITDGEIWQVDEIKHYIEKKRKDFNHKIRSFALGLGDRVSHRLIQSIGSAGCGFGQVVNATGQTLLNQSVMRMLEGALAPISWDCQLVLEDADSKPLTDSKTVLRKLDTKASPVEIPSLVQAPYKTMCLHPFARQSVFFLMNFTIKSMPTCVTVRAQSSSGHSIVRKIAVSSKDVDVSMIRELAAKAVLLDLQNSSSWLHTKLISEDDITASPDNLKVQKVAEYLDSKYGITSKWTAYVTIDRTSRQDESTRSHQAKQARMKMHTYGSTPVVSQVAPVTGFLHGDAAIRSPPVNRRGFKSGSKRSDLTDRRFSPSERLQRASVEQDIGVSSDEEMPIAVSAKRRVRREIPTRGTDFAIRAMNPYESRHDNSRERKDREVVDPAWEAWEAYVRGTNSSGFQRNRFPIKFSME